MTRRGEDRFTVGLQAGDGSKRNMAGQDAVQDGCGGEVERCWIDGLGGAGNGG